MVKLKKIKNLQKDQGLKLQIKKKKDRHSNTRN
jgi:hypothetical protein